MDKRKTILHIMDMIAVGGTENMVKNTISLLSDYDNILVYLYHHQNEPEIPESEFGNIPIYCLNSPRKTDFFQAVRKLRKIIYKHEVHIIHSHLFWSTLIARSACKSSVKFFYSIHNIMSQDAFEVNNISLLAEKYTYKPHHSVIAVSGEVLKDYKKYINIKGKAFVLYNFVSEDYFEQQFIPRQSINQEFRLVAVGTLRRQKNYEKLIESFLYLKDIPVSLDIYGAGQLYDPLQKQIEDSKLPVKLKGAVSNIPDILPLYDAYIMSSIFEGFGLAPMEAMAVGMPVLLSDISVFREVAGDSPLYFQPEDAVDIASKIRYAYNNYSGLLMNSSNNKSHIESFATKDQYLKNLLKIYNT